MGDLKLLLLLVDADGEHLPLYSGAFKERVDMRRDILEVYIALLYVAFEKHGKTFHP